MGPTLSGIVCLSSLPRRARRSRRGSPSAWRISATTRSAGRHHAGRQPAGGQVGLDGRGQFLRNQALVGVAREHADVASADADDVQRPPHGRVCLVGEVDGRARALASGALLQRDGERGEVGQRAAAEEQPRGGRGQPAQLAQPVQHHQLDHRRARRRAPGAGKDAEAGRQRVGQHADRVARPRHVGEEARVIDAQARSEHVAQRGLEHLVRIASVLGQRLAQTRFHLGSRRGLRPRARREGRRAARRSHRPPGSRGFARLRAATSGSRGGWSPWPQTIPARALRHIDRSPDSTVLFRGAAFPIGSARGRGDARSRPPRRGCPRPAWPGCGKRGR